MTKSLLLAICCATAFQGRAAELPVVPLFRFGIIADNVGAANLVPADITGDGVPEIISCSNGSPFALEHRDGAYPQRWYGRAVGCNGVATGDVDGDGATDVIVAGSEGLLIFDPRGSGAARASVALPVIGTDVAFGNVDFDAAPEIVVTSHTNTYVYDAATLELQWTATGHSGPAVFIADVDGDARNEIVLGDGSILDGGNEVLKWGYLGGFPQLTVGNVDADAKAEILFSGTWTSTVTVLHGDTMTTSTVTGFDIIEQLAVGDADGDGVNEVIAGNQWGEISGRRADSTLVWSIHNPKHGCMAVAVADVDGDGVREVLWGAGWSSSGEDALFVGNPITETIEWQSFDLDGPFYVTAGDLDGDGRTEIVAVTARSNSGYDGPVVKVFDALTGAEVRTIESAYYSSYASRVAIAQLDADPALEIAVGLSSAMVVYDGVTGAVDWTSPGSLSGMHIANVDADAIDEIITYYDGKIVVMHGISNIIQSSRVFSGYVLAAGDVTGDGLAEVVARTSPSSSTLFLLSPTLTTLAEVPLSSPAAAAITPEDGGKIAVLSGSDGTLRLFDQTLTEQWMCASVPGNDDYSTIAFGSIAGQLRLLTSDSTGQFRAMPLGGNTCPAFDSADLGRLTQIITADVTGDGRAEILAGSSNAAELMLIGLPDEMRGDVNGDAVIAANDIDQLVDYLFGHTIGLSPAGDANADQRLSGEDAFALIHHEYGGGSLPSSQHHHVNE